MTWKDLRVLHVFVRTQSYLRQTNQSVPFVSTAHPCKNCENETIAIERLNAADSLLNMSHQPYGVPGAHIPLLLQQPENVDMIVGMSSRTKDILQRKHLGEPLNNSQKYLDWAYNTVLEYQN